MPSDFDKHVMAFMSESPDREYDVLILALEIYH
jgi:hypothetical protein